MRHLSRLTFWKTNVYSLNSGLRESGQSAPRTLSWNPQSLLRYRSVRFLFPWEAISEQSFSGSSKLWSTSLNSLNRGMWVASEVDTSTFPPRDTLRLERDETLVSRQAESDQPHAKNTDFKPSKEVREKMRPVSRESFTNLLRRAANSPAQKSDPRAKQT